MLAGWPVEGDLDRGRRLGADRGDLQAHGEHAVAAVKARAKGQLLDGDRPAALEPRPSPGSHRRRLRSHPGRAAEQHRPEEAQVALGHEPGAPAGARAAALLQARAEGAAADRELVAGAAQLCADVEPVFGEHRVALEHQRFVEVDLGDGRDSIERQQHPLAVPGGLGVERRAEPPVLAVEVVVLARAPVSRGGQCAGGRAGNGGGDPSELAQLGRAGAQAGRRGGRPPSAGQLERRLALHLCRDCVRVLSLSRHLVVPFPHPRRRRVPRAFPAGRTRAAVRA